MYPAGNIYICVRAVPHRLYNCSYGTSMRATWYCEYSGALVLWYYCGTVVTLVNCATLVFVWWHAAYSKVHHGHMLPHSDGDV